MDNLRVNLSHMIMATVVIAAAVVLVVTNHITGGEGLLAIGSAGGFTLGAGAASGSISVAAPTGTATTSSTGPSLTTVETHPATPAPIAPTGP